MSFDTEIAPVSVVGAGIANHPEMPARMSSAVLAEEGVNIDMIASTALALTCVVAAPRAEDAVRALHDHFIEEVSVLMKVAVLGAHGSGGPSDAGGAGAHRAPVDEQVPGVPPFRRDDPSLPGPGDPGAGGGGGPFRRGASSSPAGSGPSRRWAPVAARAGAVVIDNSSAWRMDPQVPLVVPEVNGEDARSHGGIIANPNCATIQALVALAPLHREAGLEYFSAATYQSVSGTGSAAVEALREGTRQVLEGRTGSGALRVPPSHRLQPCFPTSEPSTTRGSRRRSGRCGPGILKILHLPELAVSSTTVRVPVFRGHGEALVARFREDLSPERAREILSCSPGVVLADDPARGVTPPREAEGTDPVYVGRIRRDTGIPGPWPSGWWRTTCSRERR